MAKAKSGAAVAKEPRSTVKKPEAVPAKAAKPVKSSIAKVKKETVGPGAKAAAAPKKASGAGVSKKVAAVPKTVKKATAAVTPKAIEAKSAVAKKAKTTAKPTTKPTTKVAKSAVPKISSEQRKHYVEIAAYFIAERRGFAPGNSLEDWVAAEVQVDQLLAAGKLGG